MTGKACLITQGFTQFREVNVRRCEAVFHKLDDWSPGDWMTAACGELGEAANLVKKLRRGEEITPLMIAEELADAVTYVDLLAARLGIDLGRAVVTKFDIVSQRRGSNILINGDRNP
jgi:NTP pyrophosphatase (non-canonical NTP hydrolase)